MSIFRIIRGIKIKIISWQIANLDEFYDSDLCRCDAELAMLTRKERAKRVKMLRELQS